MAQEWKLRLRGPQGTPAELVLPAGGETSLADLAQLAGKATNVAAARLILRCGFPPRPIDHAGAKKDQSIATDGLLQNRDMLTIERKPAPDGTAGAAQQPAPAKKRKARGKGFSKAAGAGHQLGHATGGGTTVAPAEAAAASAAAAPARDGRVDPYAASPKKKRRTKMPGGGMRLGASDEDPAEAAAAQAAIDRRQRPAASAAPAAAAQDEPEEVPEEPATVDEILRAHGFGSIRGGHTLGGGSGQAAGDGASLGSAVNRTEAAQNAAAADLVDAVSRTSQRTVHRVLRHDLKNARELREQEAEAERRIAAALGGRCSFVSLQDGSMNMCVTYKVGPRKEKEESVQDIPRPLLKVRLRHPPPQPASLHPLDSALAFAAT
jgi:hypothetical protein